MSKNLNLCFLMYVFKLNCFSFFYQMAKVKNFII